jgi:fimbrial isopeptide formation D2 family protein/uncharacterized repeat protein (TIGR01451 family)
MLTNPLSGKLATVIICVILMAHIAVAFASDGPTPSGTVITNQAQATYQDDSGTSYAIVSPTVSLTILSVSAIVVTPDETEPSATVVPHQSITRVFRVCNSGNTPNAYTITRADVNSPAILLNLYFDNDASGTVTGSDALIQLNATSSNSVNPGSCIGVLAVVDTADSPENSLLTIHLTARSNAGDAINGHPQDDGTIINTVAAGARITSPDGSGVPVKTVNGITQALVTPGTPFTYSIAFKNSSDTPARQVVLTDQLDPRLGYTADSLTLDGRNLTDVADSDEGTVQAGLITVQLAQMAPSQVVTVTFKASLTGNVAGGVGVINFANFTGQNIAPVKSSTAVVLTDPFGTVFSGRAGSAVVIPGAAVEILVNQDGSNPLGTVPGAGFPPNLRNSNPFATDSLGHFSFALSPDQLGTEATPARYFLKITAPGYSTRQIEITLQPTQAGLFGLTVHALDTQPLASAGGFNLVNQDVAIQDMASMALNIPMFEPHGLEITKSADRPQVNIGEAVAYRIEVSNPTAAPVSGTIVHDRLPVSFKYASGTGRLTEGMVSRSIEPEMAGDEILFRIGDIAPGASAQLLYRARVGVNARIGEQDNIALAEGVFASGQHDQTSIARATVTVGGGVFSTQQVIVGRVFVDVNHNGKFDDGDKPMPGVRLFLNSGQSVTTDSKGLYNFPVVNSGPYVISLDPITISRSYALGDDGTLAGRSWTRLLRTPIGGGTLLRQNFVLVPADTAIRSREHASATRPRTVAAAALNQSQIVPASYVTKAADLAKKPSAGIEMATPPVSPLKALVKDGPTVPGIYELFSDETVEAVKPGGISILQPTPNGVVMSPALQVDVRVALGWKVKLEVNGKVISDKNIGTSRLDQKNQVATYSFVGLDVHPGPNRVRVTTISPEGVPGDMADFAVRGRGPAKRLELTAEKTSVQADGRDYSTVHVRAFDQWGSPALDDQVALDTTSGQLMRLDQQARSPGSIGSPSQVAGMIDQKPNQPHGMIVPLVGGEATVRLIASGSTGEAKLSAHLGQSDAETKIRIIPASRPTILVGLADVSVGQSIPEINLNGDEGHYHSRLSFFYSGNVGSGNLLTLAYDSERAINRTAGRDRLFQQDPLDRAYPLFGDSSTRFDAAPSNSKLYARIDHDRSYAMFGDFEADMEDLGLVGYTRKLTGVKLHVENAGGSFLTVTGARPDTAFARDVFPAGGLGLLRLSHGNILPGSETIAIEIRDRRNPEIILSTETLSRSIDYNLDPITGDLLFLRYISTFDLNLNLVQLVATYEHQSDSLSSAVYTARARKKFVGLGLQLGWAGVMQRQEDTGSFMVVGFDGQKQLPHKGVLRFAIARSQGEMIDSGNAFDTGNSKHDGNAFLAELNQPISFYHGVLRARYSYSTAGFLNPFGATVTAGTRRAEVSVDLQPRSGSKLHFGVMDERNLTANVDNSRFTLSAGWDQVFRERFRFHLGYDHRQFEDTLANRTTDSNLVTAGANVQVTDKLQLSVKREQNLGEADPTYPNQTTLAATYQIKPWSKIFLTQRLASAAIMPIADFSNSGAGFASTGSTRETALGVETKLGKYSALTSSYELDNGINGTDSFALIGLQNRLPINKQFSVELGFERGFHLAGNGDSFYSTTLGFGWQPNSDFRATVRYEFRNRNGVGQLISLGAAGRIREGVTALTRFQYARTDFNGQGGLSVSGTAALAFRPLKSDRTGLLFSYNHRSLVQDSAANSGLPQTRDRVDSLSSDGYVQATKALEVYGHVAMQLNANGQADLPYLSTLTYLTQGRLQYRLTRRFDWAGEVRYLFQPSTQTQRSVYGNEIGFWALPDLRVGGGYNLTLMGDPTASSPLPTRRGFYFTVTSKLSKIFDLFGTNTSDGLVGTGPDTPAAPVPPAPGGKP